MDQKYDRYPPCVADYISSVTGSLDRPSLVGMSALAPSRILTAKDCRDLPRLILDYNILTRLTYNCAHLRSTKESLTWVTGVTGVQG